MQSIYNIPAELRGLNQWAFNDISKKSPFNKIPHNCRTGANAKSNDRTTWSSFADFEKISANENLRVGFMLSKEDSYCVIDLDVKENTSEEQIKYFEAVVERFNSYTERSTSGRGFHIWLKDALNEPGIRNGKEELYTQERYIICTGDVYLDRPIRSINDCLDDFNSYKSKLELGRKCKTARKGLTSHKDLLADITSKIKTEQESLSCNEVHLTNADNDLIKYIMKMPEGAVFDDLMNGFATNHYPTTSEADFVLCKILCIYTQDNSQVLRIFKRSQLGMRDKVSKRKDYAIRTIAAARSAIENDFIENDIVDTERKAELLKEVQGVFKVEQGSREKSKFEIEMFDLDCEMKRLPYPPSGTKLEKLCRWVYANSYCAVDEISIITGIAAFAGLFGHQYNISNTGLNLYLMLVARSGVGKNAINDGLDALQKSVEEFSGEGGEGGVEFVATDPTNLMQLYTFMTQQTFASSSALFSLFSENNRRSVLSVWSEFGQKLKQFSMARADSRMAEMKQVLTSIFDKSGVNSYLGGVKYSNKIDDKIVKESFAFSILGEMTPQTYEDGVNGSMAEDGFLSRFLTIEYDGKVKDGEFHLEDERPKVPREILELFNEVFYSEMEHGIKVILNDDVKPVYYDFLELKNEMMDATEDEALRQMWSRAPIKVLKLAALVACGEELKEPKVKMQHFKWSLDVVRFSMQKMFKRIKETGMASGDTFSVQVAEMKRIIKEFIEKGLKGELPSYYEKFVDTTGLAPTLTIPHSYLSYRLSRVKSFKNAADTLKSIEKTELDLINQGAIVEVSRRESLDVFKFTGKLFRIVNLDAFKEI